MALPQALQLRKSSSTAAPAGQGISSLGADLPQFAPYFARKRGWARFDCRAGSHNYGVRTATRARPGSGLTALDKLGRISSRR